MRGNSTTKKRTAAKISSVGRYAANQFILTTTGAVTGFY